jgi:hypothetical protein
MAGEEVHPSCQRDYPIEKADNPGNFPANTIDRKPVAYYLGIKIGGHIYRFWLLIGA